MAKNGQIAKEVLDQYFTPVHMAEQYAEMVVKMFGKDAKYIEPAAGDGVFVSALIKCGVDPKNVVAFDLDPKADVVGGVRIVQSDFFDVPESEIRGRIAIGNPPYGKGGSLAIKFMNRLVDAGALHVCFLNPLCVGNKHFTLKSLHRKLHVVSCSRFPEDLHFRYPSGDGKVETKPNPVRCEFQIWSVRKHDRECKESRRETTEFEIVSVTPQKGKHDDGRSKELEMHERSDYNELKSKIDFTIVSHGTKAGTILDFCPSHKCTVKMFVHVKSGFDKEEIRKKLEEIDLTKLTEWSTISHNPSISPSEVIEYVESKWKTEVDSDPLSFLF